MAGAIAGLQADDHTCPLRVVMAPASPAITARPRMFSSELPKDAAASSAGPICPTKMTLRKVIILLRRRPMDTGTDRRRTRRISALLSCQSLWKVPISAVILMYRALHTQIILLCVQGNRLAADIIEQKASATPRRRTLISLSAGRIQGRPSNSVCCPQPGQASATNGNCSDALLCNAKLWQKSASLRGGDVRFVSAQRFLCIVLIKLV